MWPFKKRTWEIVKWEKWEEYTTYRGVQIGPVEPITRIWYVSDDGKTRIRDVSGHHTDEEVRRIWPKP